MVGGGAFGYAPRLARSLREGRLSLLHANGLWMYPSLASRRWSRRARRPYLIAPHGMLDPWAVAHSAWKKRLVGWWFENAHLAGAACLHALTAAEARALRSYGLRNPICVVPNGVDPPIEPVSAGRPWAGETLAGLRAQGSGLRAQRFVLVRELQKFSREPCAWGSGGWKAPVKTGRRK